MDFGDGGDLDRPGVALQLGGLKGRIQEQCGPGGHGGGTAAADCSARECRLYGQHYNQGNRLCKHPDSRMHT
eukprot:1139450-Pelagomonas_calceolata.AAC.4